MITSMSGSSDLAAVLNDSVPLTPEDATETPRDWIAGLWVAGQVYPLDPDQTTDQMAALADGTAAARWSPKGVCCLGQHRVGIEYEAPHWCVADTDAWTFGGDVRGVIRDWRSVTIWDANGYSATETYPTLDAAKAAFEREVAEMEEYCVEEPADD